MDNEKNLSPQESLKLITEMMQKAKNEFYATGISALLWGGVITFCGIYSYLGVTFNWPFKYDVWYLTSIAIIPQIFITVKEGKPKGAKQRMDGVGAAWIAFVFTMIGLGIYTGITIPYTVVNSFKAEHLELLLKNTQDNSIKTIQPFTPKFSSVYLLIYAFPTLITGIGRCFKPMIYGAVICYICFIISCFCSDTIDLLLQSVAAISCWLIPGLILQKRFKKAIANSTNV